MASSSYIDLLKDPRWQKKRLEILQRDGWACMGCSETTKTLHVHHRQYLPRRKPWEYDDALLVTLCEDCHEATTNTRKLIDAGLGKLPPGLDRIVLGFIDALTAISGGSSKVVHVADRGYADGVASVILAASGRLADVMDSWRVLESAQASGGCVNPFAEAVALETLDLAAPDSEDKA